MLQFVMRDKGFSTTGGFVFLDEAGYEMYRSDGKNWSLSREHSFKGANGAELFHLKQKLISLSPTYTITREGDHYATVKGSSGKFTIRLADRSRITATKCLTGVQFEFKRGQDVVAVVKRKLVSLMENCRVEVERSEDAELILASLVAIFDVQKH